MITHSIVFTPESRTRLIAEGVLDQWGAMPSLPTVLPNGLWPAAGDLFVDDRLSEQYMFIVVNRMFKWDKVGDLVYQLLLDIAPLSIPLPDPNVSGTVLPFVR